MSHHEGHQLTLADVDGDAEGQAKTIKCFGFLIRCLPFLYSLCLKHPLPSMSYHCSREKICVTAESNDGLIVLVQFA